MLAPVWRNENGSSLIFTNIESDLVLGAGGDQCEGGWSFTPNSSWVPAVYHIRVGSNLEDVRGNDIAGPSIDLSEKTPMLQDR